MKFKHIVAASVAALAALAAFADRDTAIYRGKLTSDMNANEKRITNVASPSAPGDAANKEYVDAHGGGGRVDTNTVREIVQPMIDGSTNGLRRVDDMSVYETVRTENTDWTLVGNDGTVTQCTSEWMGEGFAFYRGGVNVAASDTTVSRDATTATWAGAPEIGFSGVATRTSYMDESIAPNPDQQLASVTTNGVGKVAEGDMVKLGANARLVKAEAGTDYADEATGTSRQVVRGEYHSETPNWDIYVSKAYEADVYNGGIGWDQLTFPIDWDEYKLHSGEKLTTYLDSLSWRTTGNRTLAQYGIMDAATKTEVNVKQDALPYPTNAIPWDVIANPPDIPVIDPTDPTFSNAVLAVQVDTNTVAQIGELKQFFDDLPTGTAATSLGGIILALLGAAAYLKKKTALLETDGKASDTFVADLLGKQVAINALKIPLEAKIDSFAAEDGHAYAVTMMGTVTITMPTTTAGKAAIFQARFSAAAQQSVEFSTTALVKFDGTDCGIVKAGKDALLSAMWNGSAWDLVWKNQA